MAATTTAKEKTQIIEKLEKLLNQVAGTQTSWSELALDLRLMPLRSLRAVLYRIERTIANAYEDGHKHGQVGASA